MPYEPISEFLEKNPVGPVPQVEEVLATEPQNEFDLWNSQKQKIHADTREVYFKERETWFCSLGKNIGFEQDGKHDLFERPVLIFKKFDRNTFLGLPLTTKIKNNKYHYRLKEGGSSIILSQARLLDKRRLNRKLGIITKEDYDSIFVAYLKTLL